MSRSMCFAAGRLLLVALLAVSVAGIAAAQEAGPGVGARGTAPRFHAETNVHLDASLFAAYVSAEPPATLP